MRSLQTGMSERLFYDCKVAQQRGEEGNDESIKIGGDKGQMFTCAI